MTIEQLPNCRLAYIRRTGKYGPENKQTMERLKKWAMAKGLFNDDTVILSIIQDNPETIPPNNCRYDACIIIPNDYEVDNSVNSCLFQGGTYAVFKIIHTAEAIQETYSEMIPIILSNNYEIDTKPIIERYANKMVNHNYCEICVPLKL